jgi:hypothetical protein
VFNSAIRACVHCDGVRTQLPMIVVGVLVLLFVVTVTVRVILLRSKKHDFHNNNNNNNNNNDDDDEEFTTGGGANLSTSSSSKRAFNSNSSSTTRRRGFLYEVASCFGGCKNYMLSLTPFVILSHLDRGMMKVLFTTLQIVSTASWNLNVAFPSPFSSFLEFIAFLQLDFFEVLLKDF